MSGRTGATGPAPRDKNPPGSRSSTPTTPETSRPPELPSGPLRRVVHVRNPLGLHMRLADRFSRTARQYICAVIVYNGEAQADGKSLVDLIMLSVMPDSDVVLEVDGPDAHKAVDLLAEVLGSPSGEDYTI